MGAKLVGADVATDVEELVEPDEERTRAALVELKRIAKAELAKGEILRCAGV